MKILDGLTCACLKACASDLTTTDWVFADCNSSADLLSALADPNRSHAYRLAVDPVSVAKSARLPDDLHGIDLLVLNRDEADTYLARQGLTGLDPQASAAALLEAGAAAVVLTLGAAGALAANQEGCVRIPAIPARSVNVTGAGDSLIAAVLHALMDDKPLAEAVTYGCRAAALDGGEPPHGRSQPQRRNVGLF